MKPEIFGAKLVSKENLASKFWLFRFRAEVEFSFEAGQYLSLKVSDDGSRRMYSIYNQPGQELIELLVDVSPDGLGTKYLLGLEIGDEVEFFGPAGKFTVTEELEKDAKGKLLFMATGSGIAPIRSIILDLLENKKMLGEIKLYWGLRFEEDVFGIPELEELAERYGNFKYELALSRPSENWKGVRGRITDRLAMEVPEAGVRAYLCGASGMVSEITNYLLGLGVNKDHIYSERYL